MDETINRKEQLLNERRQSRVYQNAVLEVILPPETGGSNETAGATSSQAIHVPTTTSLILIDCSPSESAPVWSSNAMGETLIFSLFFRNFAERTLTLQITETINIVKRI